MRSICCECGILFDVKKPYNQDVETHGYCDECFSMIMKNIAVQKRQLTEEKSDE